MHIEYSGSTRQSPLSQSSFRVHGLSNVRRLRTPVSTQPSNASTARAGTIVRIARDVDASLRSGQRRRVRRIALIVSLGIVGLSSTAHAQGCADGLVITPETQGRCCWPGQTWSDAYNRCDGPPQCPDGWLGSGGSCVRAAVSAQPITPQPQISGPQAQAISPVPPRVAPVPGAIPPQVAPGTGDAVRTMIPSPPSPDWRVTFDAASVAPAAVPVVAPAGPAAPVAGGLTEVREPNHPLLGTGTGFLLAGYIPAVIAAIDLLVRQVPCNGWGGAYFVPVVGSIIGGAGEMACVDSAYGRYSSFAAPPDALAIVGFSVGAVQILGFSLLVAGIAMPRVRYVARAERDDAGPRLALTASGIALEF